MDLVTLPSSDDLNDDVRELLKNDNFFTVLVSLMGYVKEQLNFQDTDSLMLTVSLFLFIHTRFHYRGTTRRERFF